MLKHCLMNVQPPDLFGGAVAPAAIAAAFLQSKIVTLDLNAPNWQKGVHWGGEARDDPTQHRLWKKRVTFYKVGGRGAEAGGPGRAEAGLDSE